LPTLAPNHRRPAIAEPAGDQQGSLDAPTQDPAGLKTLVLPNLPPSRHSPILPIAAEKSALRRNFKSPTKEESCFPKAVLKGCRRNIGHERLLGGFVSISSVMEQLRTRTQAMKVSEVADLLNLDPDTIVRYANEQKIPAFKVGSRWRFDPHVLAMWIEQLSSLGGEPDAGTAQVEDSNA
jgi:excisionase family DNA binding protein